MDALDIMLAAIKPHIGDRAASVESSLSSRGVRLYGITVFGGVECEYATRFAARVDSTESSIVFARALSQLAAGQCVCSRCVEDRAIEALGQEASAER